MKDIMVGSELRPGDVADLMEWVEKRVSKRSKEPMDIVWLSLVAAELSILLVRRNWNYVEPVDESIDAIRKCAKESAEVIYGESMDD